MSNSEAIDAKAPRSAAYATPDEAAAYVRLSTRTLRRAVGARRLRAYRVGGRRLYRYEDLDAFVTGAGAH